MPKPQRRCVFCDRTGLSKEHIWSEWTYQLVPTTRFGSHERGLITALPGRRTGQVDRLKKYQGSVNTIKLRVVCERHCNNGWMSGLELLAKPILTPLIGGGSCLLTESQQQIIARWAATKVIVSEHAQRELAATSVQQRRDIMDGLVAEASWQIWIAKHNSRQWHAGGYFRQAVTLGTIDPASGYPVRPNNLLSKNTQAVTFGLGALLIYVIQTGVPDFGQFSFTGQLGDGLQQINPSLGLIEWPASVVLSDQQIEHVTTAFDRYASKLRWIGEN